MPTTPARQKALDMVKEGKTKPSEWLGKHGPWVVYAQKNVAESFERETGLKAPWGTTKAKVLNKTVGKFKGLVEPLPDPEELIVLGYVMAGAIASRFCEKTTYMEFHGRGSSFDAAVEDLKNEGL